MNIIVLPYLFFFTRVVTASLLLIIALLLSQTVAQPLAHCGHAPHRLVTLLPSASRCSLHRAILLHTTWVQKYMLIYTTLFF